MKRPRAFVIAEQFPAHPSSCKSTRTLHCSCHPRDYTPQLMILPFGFSAVKLLLKISAVTSPSVGDA